MHTLKVDASNILVGGGKTHLVELLRHADPEKYDFERVIVYGHHSVLNETPDRPWLEKRTPNLFSYGYLGRLAWKIFDRKQSQNSIWFVPGAGSAPGNYVTMCQNLLPLVKEERNRYFPSTTWLRLLILSVSHPHAYTKAKGVVFLNDYGYKSLPLVKQRLIQNRCIIPHGVSESFFRQRVSQNTSRKLKLIYVSTVDVYKHQWSIAQAVKELREEGLEVEVDFIGTAYPKALKKLAPYLNEHIRYHGGIGYDALPQWYNNADVFIFGSTCESFGMVLLEAMACGLPVLCSKYSSLPETLGDHAFYFDPQDIHDIKRIIMKSYSDREELTGLALRGQEYACQFTWKRTAQQTFAFLADCYKN